MFSSNNSGYYSSGSLLNNCTSNQRPYYNQYDITQDINAHYSYHPYQQQCQYPYGRLSRSTSYPNYPYSSCPSIGTSPLQESVSDRYSPFHRQYYVRSPIKSHHSNRQVGGNPSHGAPNNPQMMQQVRPQTPIRQDGNCPLNALQNLAGSAGGPGGNMGPSGAQQGQMMMQQGTSQQPNIMGGAYGIESGQQGSQNTHMSVQRVGQPQMQRAFVSNSQYQQPQESFGVHNQMSGVVGGSGNVSITSDGYGNKVASVNYNNGSEMTPAGIPRVSSAGHLNNMQMEQPVYAILSVSTLGGANSGTAQPIQLRPVSVQPGGSTNASPAMVRMQVPNSLAPLAAQPAVVARPPSTGPGMQSGSNQSVVRSLQDEQTLKKLEEIQTKYSGHLKLIIQNAKDSNERQKFTKIQQILANPYNSLSKLHDSTDRIRNVIETQFHKISLNSQMVPTPSSSDSSETRAPQSNTSKDSLITTGSGEVSTSMTASRSDAPVNSSTKSSTRKRAAVTSSTASSSSVSGSASAPQSSSMREMERPPEMGSKLKQLITECMKDPAQMDRFQCARRQTFEELAPVRDQLGVREISSLFGKYSKTSLKENNQDDASVPKKARGSGNNTEVFMADSTTTECIENSKIQENCDSAGRSDLQSNWNYENIQPRTEFPEGENGLSNIPACVIDEIRSISVFLDWTFNSKPPQMSDMETEDTCVDAEEWNNSWHILITHKHKHLPYDIPPLNIRLPEDYETRRVANWYIDESAYNTSVTLPNRSEEKTQNADSQIKPDIVRCESSSIDQMLHESLVSQEFNLNRKEFLEEILKETKYRFSKLRQQHESQWSLTRILNVWMTSILQGLSNAIGYRNLICTWRTRCSDSILS